jgi:ankyrin repeat protein
MASEPRALAFAALALTLASCAKLEEMKKRSQRQRAESAFVDAVGSSPVHELRSALEQDQALANGIRREPGDEGSYPKESALTMAIKHRQRDVLDLLLSFGADPNRVDGAGESPLQVALTTEAGRREKVALLLEKGADPERVHAWGSALHQAAGSTESVSRDILPLLLAKASSAGRPGPSGWTPLHSAARSANEPAIRLLIAKGADVDARTTAPQQGHASSEDAAGQTPLAIVARDRQIGAAATLCALGANPDLPDSKGTSPRQVAARVAQAEAAKANPIDVDLARHKNMAAFLAKGATCDALLARKRGGEQIAEAEVLRIANESECEAGWGWACGQAGWAYYKGQGAREDDARALALFRRGCETALTKNEWCCGMTGILHVEGSSVPKDPAEGARWLAKGCETKDPKRADEQACNRLGLLYAEGRGVAKDVARARALFKRACDAKFEKACSNLAKYAGD